MFNYAIFRKTLRDSAWSIVLSAMGLIAFAILFVWAMINMGEELLDFVSKFPFIQRIFEMSFGINVSGEVSMEIMFAVCFTHSVVLALTWFVIIAATTRMTAGEIERGTADMLLALPVTRFEVYFSATLAWVIAAMILSASVLVGVFIAINIFQPGEGVRITKYVPPALNYFCLALAVGGISSMIACFMNRRGPAIGVILGVVLLSVVLNFLEPFIEWIKSIRFLSLLHYFRPVDIVRSGDWPLQQMCTLVILGVVTWAIGWVAFSRKDIPTA